MKSNKGITLVALIITIIVMLILVGVSISVLINSDLIGTAKGAGDRTETAYSEEGNMSAVTIGGTKYNSIDEYLLSKEEKKVTFELVCLGGTYTYSVEEGTTWREFALEVNPHDLGESLFLTDNGEFTTVNFTNETGVLHCIAGGPVFEVSGNYQTGPYAYLDRDIEPGSYNCIK